MGAGRDLRQRDAEPGVNRSGGAQATLRLMADAACHGRRVMQYRLPCFGVDRHMHGPRTARLALALGALALALYVVAYLLVGSCDRVMSPYIPLVAGGLCVAVLVALGLLGGDHDGRHKQGALDWIAIIAFSLIAATGTVFGAGLFAYSHLLWC